MLSTTDDLRIRELKELSTPEEVMREVPRTLTATRVVMAARNAIHAILTGQDDRLLVVVGAYFLAEGVVTIMYALEHRRELSERWSWLLISGVMDLLIAFIIVAGLPDSAQWAIGLLVGINLVLGGASMVGVALAARNA